MNHEITGQTIYARAVGFPEGEGAPEYDRSCLRETRFTLVRGCRTFVALDSDGVVVVRGILEPGGDRAQLFRDMQTVLEIIDQPAVEHRPTLQLVRD